MAQYATINPNKRNSFFNQIINVKISFQIIFSHFSDFTDSLFQASRTYVLKVIIENNHRYNPLSKTIVLHFFS